MFTQKCFIRKNTAGLRRKLRKMGYTECMTLGDLSCIVISNNNYCWNGSFDLVSSDVVNNIGFRKPHIDCGDNEDLFLAIAALRDDTDKYKCITNGKIFMTCEKDDINEFVAIIYDGYHFENEEERKDALSNRWHKLTVYELIEHFK